MGLVKDIITGDMGGRKQKQFNKMIKEKIEKQKQTNNVNSINSMINPQPIFQYSQMAQTAMTKTKPVTDA